MKQLPKLRLVITDDQGHGDPGQLIEKSLDQTSTSTDRVMQMLQHF